MNNLHDKSLIIFDWDGTLMNSVDLIVKAMQSSATAQGLHIDECSIKSIIGLSLINAIHQLFPNNPEKHEAIIQGYADFYIANDMTTQLFFGIDDLLEKLKNQGKLLAVATGKKRVGLERVLASSQTKHYFTISRCADEAGSKPDPQMLKDILVATNKQVTDAVFIGDSIYDIQMANAIGMDSIAVNYGCEKAEVLAKQNPTYQVNNVQDLTKLLIADVKAEKFE